MPKEREITYKEEVIRKLIHLTSISIPIGYSLLSKETTLWILIPLAIAFFVTDMLMKFIKPIRNLVLFLFGSIMRPHEVKNEIVLNGATWVFISAISCILILPKIAAVTGFAILIISDTSAALIGKKFGKHKIFHNKSLEGSSAFVISAMLVVSVITYLIKAPISFFIFGCICALLGGIIEGVSGILKIDDNFSIPLGIGLLLWACDFIAKALMNQSYINIMH